MPLDHLQREIDDARAYVEQLLKRPLDATEYAIFEASIRTAA